MYALDIIMHFKHIFFILMTCISWNNMAMQLPEGLSDEVKTQVYKYQNNCAVSRDGTVWYYNSEKKWDKLEDTFKYIDNEKNIEKRNTQCKYITYNEQTNTLIYSHSVPRLTIDINGTIQDIDFWECPGGINTKIRASLFNNKNEFALVLKDPVGGKKQRYQVNILQLNSEEGTKK